VHTTQVLFTGGWQDLFVASLEQCVREILTDHVGVVDLGGLAEVDPVELAEAFRRGVRGGFRKRKQRPLRGAEGPAYVTIEWKCGDPLEEVLRAGFRLAWETLDREDPEKRLPLVWRTEEDVSILGHLPKRLREPNLSRLIENRLITYHAFSPEPVTSVREAKRLGKLLQWYGELGLVVPRRYADRDSLEELGLGDELHERSRPQLWESVPAAVRGMKPRRLRRGR
jgi:hypothetical protein